MCWVRCCSFCGTCAVEQVPLCRQRADSVRLQLVPGSCSCSQEQRIDHRIPKRETLEHPPWGGKLRYRFSAFWLDPKGLAICGSCDLPANMPTVMESEEEIGEFISTNETVSKDDAMVNDAVPDAVQGEAWAEESLDVPFPDVLTHLAKNGMRFSTVPFFCGDAERPKLIKNLSVYFSVDTIVTSQQILEAFDAAQIDIDDITSIQWQVSNRTWIVSFDSQLAKETALETSLY